MAARSQEKRLYSQAIGLKREQTDSNSHASCHTPSLSVVLNLKSASISDTFLQLFATPIISEFIFSWKYSQYCYYSVFVSTLWAQGAQAHYLWVQASEVIWSEYIYNDHDFFSLALLDSNTCDKIRTIRS